MIKITDTQVYGLENAKVKAGLPKNSDGPPQATLKALGSCRTGSGHDSYLKGVIVQFDLKYPEYFSPQLQRYHWIDIISSQSKMHKLTDREKFTWEDFTEEVSVASLVWCNILLAEYKEEPSEENYRWLLANLPAGYLKTMAITTNYLQLKTIYHQRKTHKLKEWKEFCRWIESLPEFKDLVLGGTT